MERRSEGHIAVAFGDRNGLGSALWDSLHVFLDDREVTDDCTEAEAVEGWVRLWDKGKKRWPGEVVYGDVRIEGWPAKREEP